MKTTKSEAIRLLKNGEIAIKKDVEDLEKLKDILKKAFPEDYFLKTYKLSSSRNAFKYFIIDSYDNSKWYSPDLQYLPKGIKIINLSDITDDEVYEITKEQVLELYDCQNNYQVNDRLEQWYPQAFEKPTLTISEAEQKLKEFGVDVRIG